MEAKAATGALAAAPEREEAERRATAGAEARTRSVVCIVARSEENEEVSEAWKRFEVVILRGCLLRSGRAIFSLSLSRCLSLDPDLCFS
jgi:hypothetical protein